MSHIRWLGARSELLLHLRHRRKTKLICTSISVLRKKNYILPIAHSSPRSLFPATYPAARSGPPLYYGGVAGNRVPFNRPSPEQTVWQVRPPQKSEMIPSTQRHFYWNSGVWGRILPLLFLFRVPVSIMVCRGMGPLNEFPPTRSSTGPFPFR